MQYVGAKLEINQLTAIEEEIGKAKVVWYTAERKNQNGNKENEKKTKNQKHNHPPTDQLANVMSKLKL